MRCKITTAKDLQLKLHETVIRYDKKPVYVRTDGKTLYLYDLERPSGEYIQACRSDDERLDISSIPMGYVQIAEKVYYLTRMPMRLVRQGISPKGINIRGFRDRDDAGRMRYSAAEMIFSKGFKNMCADKYPELREAINGLRDKLSKDPKYTGEVAISKDIALGINEMGIIDVHFKCAFVGWMQPGKWTVHVKKDGISWVISKYLSHVLNWIID